MPNFPNRCQHIKVNGTLCGSPALRRNRFCYFHKLHHEELIQLNLDRAKTARARRNIAVTLPVLEDANSIQVTLMQVMRLILTGQIDGKNAGLLLYALQTASSNLPRTNFQPFRHEVILDTKTVGEAQFGPYLWKDEDFLDDEEEEDEEENANPNIEDPRPNFTPRTAQEARNQAELDRWAKAEADRLAILGARQREAEDKIERIEEELYAEREEERQATETRALERDRVANRALASATPAATVTPAGNAIIPAKTVSPPNKRPPE